ncbi:MAG: sigma-54 dependent transcriptional regulator [Thermodesulfovibrionales bacterium]|nr:sigma-54 dependent transcriptional regulator [Thermodesulfovibrionales bacterium]
MEKTKQTNQDRAKILIAEDEKGMREVLEIFLQEEGYRTLSVRDGRAAIEALEKDIFDLVITDIKMPRADGFEVLRKVKEVSPDTVVIMITAYGTTESALEAIKLGAYDYIEKPFKIEEIRVVIKRALERKKFVSRLSLQERLKRTEALSDIIYSSEKMKTLMEALPRIAQSSSNVLITGESGVGKELFAHALHKLSPRASKEFVAINCAAFPEGLLESELFGHMKGAFTDAHYNKQGLFEIADGGTVFLDEIGDMPISLQAKLLRVIENGTFRRVGGISDIKVDVRIIAATNKDIKKEVEEGKFREDLYYRLNVIPVHIPPLRERREDIPLLIEHFIKKYHPGKSISQEAMEALKNYRWRGNVRELENVIERLCLLVSSDLIELKDLPPEIIIDAKEKPLIPELTPSGINLDRIVEEIEKQYIMKALKLTKNTKVEAARLLGLTFRSFRYRLKKYNIEI